MIKFFRKIRQQLLAQNRISKYLFYAIGEIVLVVIGILIALSINTWNNNRLDREKEVQFLSEIKSNLEQDLNSAEAVLTFNRKKDSAIDMAFKIMGEASKEKLPVSLMKLFPFLTEYQVFLANSVAFDNMTSSESIALVSNDSLRKRLSNYYKFTASLGDFTQEQIKDQTRKFIDESITMLIDDKMVQSMVGHPIIIDQKNNFYTDPKTFKNLFNMKMNIGAQNDLMESLKHQILAILELMD